MTVYARYDGDPRGISPFITPGKLYPVTSEDLVSFYSTNDAGREVFGLWRDCAWLNGGNWTRVEILNEYTPGDTSNPEAQVFTKVYNYERDHGSAPSQAARTAGYAVSVFKRECKE